MSNLNRNKPNNYLITQAMARKPMLLIINYLAKCCRLVLYRAQETLGQHKRDLVVSRVGDTCESLEQTKAQFEDALKQFKTIVNVRDSSLEHCYLQLKRQYDLSWSHASAFSDKIRAIEEVSEALFVEWEQELEEYTNRSLKAHSRQQLKITRQHYSRLIKAMHKAENRIKPVLAAFKDQVLYMKHNLNARAIAALQHELHEISYDIAQLIRAMESSIFEANSFVLSLVEQKALPKS
jgi:hypothetical protein